MKKKKQYCGTLIILSPVTWNSPWEAAHSIATTFARFGYKVIFVEPIPKRWPSIKELKRVIGRLRKDVQQTGVVQQEYPHKNIQIFSPFVLPDTGNILRRLNKQLFLKQIISRLEIEHNPVFLFNFTPISLANAISRKMKEQVNAKIVYYCVSDWQNHPFVKRDDVFEEQILSIADIVFTDALYLYTRHQNYHSNVHRILPAVDDDLLKRFLQIHFKTTAESNHQILCGYFGTVGPNTDVELIHKVAEKYKLRLIGRVRIPREKFLPSVEIIPSVPHNDLPQFLSDIDVLIMPYNNKKPFVQGVIPAKTIECLATGLPTIIYGLSDLQPFENLFFMCDTHEEFLSAIANSIIEPDAVRRKRIEVAKEYTWSKNCRHIEELLIDTK